MTNGWQLDEYLACDEIIDWQTPEVRAKARELAGGLPDQVEQARVLYGFVRDAIPHSNDAGLDVVTCTASEVLRHGTGICFAKSHLLAALLRAVGIPAGFCYQALRLDPPANNELVLHGFNGIYLASLDRWLRIDPRGNTGGIDAQFDPERERLAFATDAAAGEFIDPEIFPSPAAGVVERLKRHKSRKRLWEDLPKPFPRVA